MLHSIGSYVVSNGDFVLHSILIYAVSHRALCALYSDCTVSNGDFVQHTIRTKLDLHNEMVATVTCYQDAVKSEYQR